MVVHDETQVQEWAQEREDKRVKTFPTLHLSVLAVQSIACCVVILLALLLRIAGGEAYASLRGHFQQALARNEWVTALAVLWDGNPIENSAEPNVKKDGFTEDDATQLTDSPEVEAMQAPLASGVLTSAYGERIHPINGLKEFHTGVDIAAPMGTDLVAMSVGEVTEVGENDQVGKYVCLRHKDGMEVLYGHCETILVQKGVMVQAGERVALVGSTGVSTGSHVHIRVSVDGVTRDPSTVLPLERYA